MSPALTVAAAAAAVLVGGLGLWSVQAARVQRRVLGPEKYHECVAVGRRLGDHSECIRTLVAYKWLAFLGGVWLVFRMWRGSMGLEWWPVALGLLVVAAVQWARQRVPPSILVLGGSTLEQLSLQATLRDAVAPFRPVSLLQTGALTEDMEIAGDCFRIDEDADWREAVFEFCRSMPLLVLDLRRITPFVEVEIEHLVTSGHLHKTLVIAAEGDEGRLADVERRLRPQRSPTPALIVGDPDAAVGLIHYLLHLRGRVSGLSESTSLTALAREWHEWREGNALAPAADPGDSAEASIMVDGLTPFGYEPPSAWSMKEAMAPGLYHALFRPAEESGFWNVLKRRTKLEFMVFPYGQKTIPDEERLRLGTEYNLGQHAVISRERMGRRCGVVSHEVFYRKGLYGHVVRFIVEGSEFVAHYTSMKPETMRRYQPVMDRLVESIRV